MIGKGTSAKKESVGGFSGMPDTSAAPVRGSLEHSRAGGGGKSAYYAHEEKAASAAQRSGRHNNSSSNHRDAAVRLASVPFHGWEEEKKGRVHVAFNRILEHEWYDKYEGNLQPHELVHINAVREHFAMRRDKLLTPDPSVATGLGPITAEAHKNPHAGVAHRALREGGKAVQRNTMSPMEWTSNMEALDTLKQSTSVRHHFRDMAMRKSIAHHKRNGTVPVFLRNAEDQGRQPF